MNSDTAIRQRRASGIPKSEDLERFRALLLQQRDALLRTSGTALSEEQGGAEESAVSDDFGDRASHLSEQDVVLEILQRAKKELEDIALSLERIDQGAYGGCEECGEPIPSSRLEAIPTATLCVRCKGRLENE